MPTTLTKSVVETAFVLVGEVKEELLFARMVWRSSGTESSVLFDGQKVLTREELRGDVVGFYHTHPEGFRTPSARDRDTMFAWSFCFGKPLLCVIGTGEGLRAWVFDAGDQSSDEVKAVLFKHGFLIADLERNDG
jgi:proteasome lid subunit RPN8/RPN11